MPSAVVNLTYLLAAVLFAGLGYVAASKTASATKIGLNQQLAPCDPA